MFFTAAQLYAHLVGDYVFQNAWMAANKTKSNTACLAHVLTYMIPFLFITTSPAALAVIAGTHFILDRWRLARWPVWARNFLAPRWINQYTVVTKEKRLQVQTEMPIRCQSWEACKATGSDDTIPPFMAVWLLIIFDNAIHIGINALAIHFL